MKAWVVTEECEGKAQVIFHTHGMAAKRLGAQELNTDFDGVTLKRAKEFDDYAEKGYVPVAVLIENGWWVECWGCNREMREEMIGEDGNDFALDLDGIIELGPMKAFHSKECKEAYQAMVIDIDLRHCKYEREIRKRFPTVSFIEGTHNKYPSYTCTLKAEFPGQKHWPAEFKIPDVRKDGKQKVEIGCAMGDEEAFRLWLKEIAPNDRN